MNAFKSVKYVALAAVTGLCFAAVSPKSEAQVVIGVGAAPVCPYGYYDYAPYPCAPYGYYGPEWFTGGVFIGAGPWFHGPRGFRGHVDGRFDPRGGYHGPMPRYGERAVPENRYDHMPNFRGSEMRDGHGGVVHGDDRH